MSSNKPLNKSNMNSKSQFELLDDIVGVDTPLYLYTRIQQRIRKDKQSKWSPQLSWSMLLGLILIVVMELVLMSKPKVDYQSNQNIVQLMNLQPDNLLYHE